ncbi:hypothetical protein SBV45_02410 [Chlamydia crocodili]
MRKILRLILLLNNLVLLIPLPRSLEKPWIGKRSYVKVTRKYTLLSY